MFNCLTSGLSLYVIKGMPGFVSCNVYICRIKSYFQHCQVAQDFKVECIHAGFKNTSVKSMLKFYLYHSKSSHMILESWIFGCLKCLLAGHYFNLCLLQSELQ